jgi:hypothetical protein
MVTAKMNQIHFETCHILDEASVGKLKEKGRKNGE